MCGRYTLHKSADDLAKRYNLATIPPEVRDNFNTAPGQIMPVVINAPGGPTELEFMKWGLVPHWSKDPKIGYKLINARAETIFEKPVWRNVILKKRCLIPADGFYEWQRPPKGVKSHKQPYYIHPKQLAIFSFAGVWESWKDAEGKEQRTFSIITTDPNKEMANIHDRMPVILHPEDERAWLESGKTARPEIEPLLTPYPDNSLETYRVSEEVNSPRNNNVHLLDPLS